VTCPVCAAPLAAGDGRCAACGSLVSPPVEGALAPDPLSGGSKVEPLREIPGMRKRERTWKDEVRERVHHRRQERGGGELPLFPDELESDASGEDSPPEASAVEMLPDAVPGAVELGDADLDLPLHSSRGSQPLRGEMPAREPEATSPPYAAQPEEPGPLPDDSLRPVERPARPGERAQAAVIDAGLLLGLWALIVYFASRAAHVSVEGLSSVWPWLAGYLAALGLLYATYFTSVTGQTLGKIVLGLRVVDVAGQPPRALRALARAALGSIGVAAGFLGLLPVLFDPAKRALHDRLLRTRVIKG
jgi:uncharacterized RDD family membrane protein YckC